MRFLCSDHDRHGNRRIYFRRHGRKIRLRHPPGSEAFLRDYRALLAGEPLPLDPEAEPSRKTPSGASRGPKAAPGSLRWLVVRYVSEAAEFKLLAPSTQTARRRILDRWCLAEGDKPYRQIERRHLVARRAMKAETPEAANTWVKTVRALFAWAADNDLVASNPAADLKKLKVATDGFHTWTRDEIAAFSARWPLGTKAHLAMALLFFTGQRRSDVALFGRQHIQTLTDADGHEARYLVFTQQKGATRKRKPLRIPVIPPLQAILDASPVGALTFLETAHGAPYTAEGFGNAMRKWCDAAGLRHCSAHGLRKAMASLLAEKGATEYQVAAILGDSSPQEAAKYTRKASQKRLAEEAMKRISEEQS